MKVPETRRKHVVALPESHELSGFAGQVKKHLNTALTVLLIIAAIAMLIRWRIRSAELAKQSIANELVNARALVQQLREFRLAGRTPADWLTSINLLQNSANSSISNVLNLGTADVKMRAEALLLRGDLYWELANLPPFPGATTQPSLALSESKDTLLQKSWDAYQEVIKNSTYADQHEELDGSHLGLAAIAENRADWATAKSELETVQNDPNALAVLVDLARLQLDQLPGMQKKLFIAPPTGIAPLAGPVAPVPTTQAVIPDAIRALTPMTP